MDLELTGKVAVVTGAGKGIGLAIARALAAEGAHVVAGSRSVTPELAEVADAVAVDVSTPDGPAELVARAGDRIDVLVNNVGLAPPRLDGFLAVTDEMWLTTWNLNLTAAVRTIRAALPPMLAAGGGAIVKRRLGQRAGARPAGHRLLRLQGRAGQRGQVAVEGVRTARDPGQQRRPRSGRDRPVAGCGRGGGPGRRGQRAAPRGRRRGGPPPAW